MNRHDGIFTILLVVLTFSFMLSLHNLDNAWNMKIVETTYGGNWCDNDITGLGCYTADEMFPQAIIGLVFSFMLLAFISVAAIVKTRTIIEYEMSDNKGN